MEESKLSCKPKHLPRSSKPDTKKAVFFTYGVFFFLTGSVRFSDIVKPTVRCGVKEGQNPTVCGLTAPETHRTGRKATL